jgi:threonine/homoserine/homoserine lactone efflux protein
VISIGHLLTFALVALIIIVIPGPSVLFVIGRALAYGRRTALATVVGNAVGAYVLVVLVAVGAGTLVERSAVLFLAMRLAGAAYLIYLGIHALRQRGSMRQVLEQAAPGRGRRRAVWDGFTVGVTNPKTIVFFGAVLPQFVDRDAGHAPVQMLLLGLVFVVIALVSDSTWGAVAGTARSWFARSPRRLEMIGGAGGLAMIGLGVTVAATGQHRS